MILGSSLHRRLLIHTSAAAGQLSTMILVTHNCWVISTLRSPLCHTTRGYPARRRRCQWLKNYSFLLVSDTKVLTIWPSHHKLSKHAGGEFQQTTSSSSTTSLRRVVMVGGPAGAGNWWTRDKKKNHKNNDLYHRCDSSIKGVSRRKVWMISACVLLPEGGMSIMTLFLRVMPPRRPRVPPIAFLQTRPL